VDRKYGHRGYRDAEKQDKKEIVTIRPAGRPAWPERSLRTAHPAHGSVLSPARAAPTAAPSSRPASIQRPVPQVQPRTPLLQAMPLLRFRRAVRVYAAGPERISPKDGKNTALFTEFARPSKRHGAHDLLPASAAGRHRGKPLLRVPPTRAKLSKPFQEITN